jgi:hypothetical protein
LKVTSERAESRHVAWSFFLNPLKTTKIEVEKKVHMKLEVPYS